MSHSRQRKDKVCLNCKAEVYGRFCHVCGQENIEPKETFWGLISHFIYDITHFDGKFFSTVKYLIFRPGYLSAQYVSGRRMSYLHPIRMYVFTSAIFFLIFFSLFNLGESGAKSTGRTFKDSLRIHLGMAKSDALGEAHTKADSIRISNAMDLIETDDGNIKVSKKSAKKMLFFASLPYNSVEEYDSLQERLPGEERDGWFTRTSTRKKLAFRDKAYEDPDLFVRQWANLMLHKFPQLLFVSLPFFAFILNLIYIRRKSYYYGDHAIFTIHLYIFTFLMLFLFIILNKVKAALDWNWLTYIQLVMVLYMVYYVYKAMRNFYQQGRLKTFMKFLLLNTLSFALMIFLLLCFVILSIFQI